MSSILRFVIAFFLASMLLPSVLSDTLFKKKTPIAIGYGNTSKATVDWSDCSEKNKKQYTRPPHWVDKGDNCKLQAESLGLKPDKERFLVANRERFSLLFPDAQLGDVAEFQVDHTTATIRVGCRVTCPLLSFT